MAGGSPPRRSCGRAAPGAEVEAGLRREGGGMALRRRRRGENAPSPLRARPPLIARARAAPLPLLTAGGSRREEAAAAGGHSPQGRAGPAVHRGAASPGGRVVVLVWFFVCFVFPRPL